MKKKFLTGLLLLAGCMSTYAYVSYDVPETSPKFIFDVYAPGETVRVDGEEKSSTFLIPQEYIKPLLISAESWYDKIKGDSVVSSAIYSYTSMNKYNADADTQYVTVKIGGAPYPYKVPRTSAKLHNWEITTPLDELNAYGKDGFVEIGLGISEEMPGWQMYTGKHSLYHNELPDLYPVMMHEMMHSLGLASGAKPYYKDAGDHRYYFSNPLTVYDAQLRIYPYAVPPADYSTLINNEVAPLAGQLVGTSGYDVITYSPYFIGNKTIQVLGGDNNTNQARQNIFDNGGIINYSNFYYDNNVDYPAVYGLPIHPSDDDEGSNSSFDLSHIELRNSYMSHQEFRNWLVPMEAELAFMNDIGYNIDLRKYFGKSYYLNGDGITPVYYTDGFSTWNGTKYTDTASTIAQAVGIHIYGNKNVIEQRTGAGENLGNILMSGEGSIGVRVDGVNNTYTLKSGKIEATGKENLGIAVTWGSGHKINVENGTSVIASGKDGIAASFDYGTNLFGSATSNVKGSFINYVADESKSIDPDVENQGPLVSNFNVNGNLEGEKAAIYISDNAYVENININDGAKITGDIVSEWNSVISTNKALVKIYDSGLGKWRDIDTNNPDEFYYTDLKIDGSGPNGVIIDGDITGKNAVFNTLRMNNLENSVLNFKGDEINVNYFENKGAINIADSKVVDINVENGVILGVGGINLTNGAGINLSKNISIVQNNVNFDGASFNTVNNNINNVYFVGMELNGQNNLAVDVDLASLSSDKFVFGDSADLTVNAGAGFKIDNVNLLNTDETRAYTDSKYYIPFISANYKNENLLGNVNFNASKNILTPIFRYNFGYEETPTSGGFALSRGALKSYGTYNPAVLVSPVAAQMGGYLSQLNSYEQAFQNLDMKMLMTREERQALRMANCYASTETPKVFSNIYLPEKDKGAWFRPYASFEHVGLKNGPNVENISYGSYFGGDSPIYETKNGWDYQYSIYAGYNGSHQNYAGNSIYQNGGTIGATGIWYKGDFFTALTANVGAGVADASTMYGSEDFPMLMTGVASKTGYNWELAKGKFIIQPSFLMSYSFVNTFDYTNAAGVRIKSDPLNAINIAPGLKFIGNLKYGWQPYVGIQMVWNIMDKTDFRANNVALADMSVKPYVQYGVGIQKRWGDRFTGFFQTMLRNGGRNGVAFSLGFRWALGK